MSREQDDDIRNVAIPSKDIFKLSIDKFNSLPRTGKPNENEWTVLSCIIEYNNTSRKATVVSLGTGTKCLGQNQMCRKGYALNDSHAEVMARRGFLRYLFANMMNSTKSSILNYCEEKGKFQIKNDINFHFFSTHSPCGDATIVANTDEVISSDEPHIKKIKLSEKCKDSFTGAKLITSETDIDLMSQNEGAIRTKPGRGVRTLSISCSDKLSRWNVMGVQGAILDRILDRPIYFDTYTFCGDVNEDSIKRAIYGRWLERTFQDERFNMKSPDIRICSSDLKFTYTQTSDKDPSPASIVWCAVLEKSLEVAVSGKRQGVTKTKKDTLPGALRISKHWFLHDFYVVLSTHPSLMNNFQLSKDEIFNLTYKQHKGLSKEYQLAWKHAKEVLFLTWTKKSEEYLEFRLDKQ